ncbi:AAA family ATPase [Dactylosporangium sucinum]|uniref:AAA family ATPase n=1 Tax=Dactylosporangium sucinum TaxID=1424081 RepID=UPI00167D31B8|nr:AAA family ATPase [Dactylosporangium sucinum]
MITIGLPGSGKTTAARAWVAAARRTRVRVNRDDLCHMLHEWWTGWPEHEEPTGETLEAAIRVLLASGKDVICDDHNLRPEAWQLHAALAKEAGVRLQVWDLTGVPVKDCIARDQYRGQRGGHRVGATRIRAMRRAFTRAGGMTSVRSTLNCPVVVPEPQRPGPVTTCLLPLPEAERRKGDRQP